jgi:phage/plasmid-associated DNA primase
VGKTKAIISGESVTGRHIHRRPFSFRPTAKHFISSNAWPKSNDRSEGYTRRWDVVLFENQLRDSGDAVDQYMKSREGLKDSDPELLNRLIANELPGFLNWCLVGLQRLRLQKWKLSDAPGFLKGAQKLRSAIDPLLQFIDENCILKPDWRVLDSKKGVRNLEGYWCQLDQCHRDFHRFCENKRYPAKEWSEAKLKQELEQKGFAVKRSRIPGEVKTSGRTENPQFWCVHGLNLRAYESVGNPIDDDDNEVSSM